MNTSHQKSIPVVILCGGKGTRLREETEYKPKPLIKIGSMPILWHIMKIYSHYGFNRFLLLLGYKGEMIKDYFLNFEMMANDFTLRLRANDTEKIELHNNTILENWDITFVDTGEETPTGGRIKKAETYLKPFRRFMVTYGDGVADINIDQLVRFHSRHGKIGTLTGVEPSSQFGIVEVNRSGLAESFKEKPRLKGYVNGGFFVFERTFLRFLTQDSVLEQKPLIELTRKKQLAVYPHTGYWQCMDTFKQAEWLNQAWESGERPWEVWRND